MSVLYVHTLIKSHFRLGDKSFSIHFTAIPYLSGTIIGKCCIKMMILCSANPLAQDISNLYILANLTY